MKRCPHCGKEYPQEATICELDGQSLDDNRSLRNKLPNQDLALPLHLRHRPTIFDEPINWLTISREGLTLHQNLPALFLKWNEIAHVHLKGTRTHGGPFWYTTWHHIVLILNGFELAPIVINVQGAERKPKEVLSIITSALNSFRNGKAIPPLARVFPKIAESIEHLPVKIGFTKWDCIRGLVLGIIIFIPFLCALVALGNAGDNMLYDSPFLSPFLAIGLGMIILYGFRLARRGPVLILSENGLTYLRGWKHLSIPGNQIIDLQLKPAFNVIVAKGTFTKMVVVLNDRHTHSISLKLGGLEHVAHAIFYATKNLHASRWARVKTTAAI